MDWTQKYHGLHSDGHGLDGTLEDNDRQLWNLRKNLFADVGSYQLLQCADPSNTLLIFLKRIPCTSNMPPSIQCLSNTSNVCPCLQHIANTLHASPAPPTHPLSVQYLPTPPMHAHTSNTLPAPPMYPLHLQCVPCASNVYTKTKVVWTAVASVVNSDIVSVASSQKNIVSIMDTKPQTLVYNKPYIGEDSSHRQECEEMPDDFMVSEMCSVSLLDDEVQSKWPTRLPPPVGGNGQPSSITH